METALPPVVNLLVYSLPALVLYIGAAFGLAYIIGHSVISRPAREWIAPAETTSTPPFGMPVPLAPWRVFVINLVECPACFGFWIGAGVGAVITLPMATLPAVAFALGLGLFTAGSNFLLARLTGLITL